MTMRMHEIHPSLVHFPLALVPTALALDAVGLATNHEGLMSAGKALMPVAAASAVVAGLFGYVAQGAVAADGEAHDLLVTHRNLNTVLVGMTGLLAATRLRSERPGAGYLLAGLSGVLAMGYTAYLGGKMVYAHRVGVEPDGVNIDKSPEIRPGTLQQAAKESVAAAKTSMAASWHDANSGEIAPTLRH